MTTPDRGPRIAAAMNPDLGHVADVCARMLERARVDYDTAVATAKMTGDRRLWQHAAQAADHVVVREAILRKRRRDAGQADLVDDTVADADLSGFERDVVAHLERLSRMARRTFAISDAIDDVSAPAAAIILSSLTDHAEEYVLEMLDGADVGDEVLIPEYPQPVTPSPVPPATSVYYVARRTR